MYAITRVRCPDVSREITIRVAAPASDIGKQVETAIARHTEINVALVGIDPDGSRDCGEVGANVAFVSINGQPAGEVPQLERAFVGVELQVGGQITDIAFGFVVFDSEAGRPWHLHRVL